MDSHPLRRFSVSMSSRPLKDSSSDIASAGGDSRIEGGLEVAAGRDGERLPGSIEPTPVCDLNVTGLHTFVVGERQALLPNTSGTGGMPRIGQELGRGAEGVVYEDLDQPGWVVKEFHQGGTSPFQAENEFRNLERARAIRPDNVVKAQAPADPRQGFLVKEQVLTTDVPPDLAQRTQVLRDFLPQIPDADGNLMWGGTAYDPSPRWLLIE